MEKKWCVYVHIAPNGKKYVGITGQKPEKRWRHGYGYNHNKHFKSAIEKYGWDNFQHIILFDNLKEAEAERLETLIIALFRTHNYNFGYNKTFGGEHPVFDKNYVSPNSQQIYCFENQKIYQSAAEAARQLGIPSYTGIIENCRETYKHCHNYHFCYLSEKDKFLNKNLDDYKNEDKRVYCFQNHMIYKTTGEAAKETKCALRTVQRRCISNDRKETPQGYSFSYVRNLTKMEVDKYAIVSR